MIDGVEHAQLDLTQKHQLQIGLEAGASLIEIRGRGRTRRPPFGHSLHPLRK